MFKKLLISLFVLHLCESKSVLVDKEGKFINEN